MTIRGVAWYPGQVEVRWGSPNGAPMRVTRGTARGPDFVIDVTVPDTLVAGESYKIFVLGDASPEGNGSSPTTLNSDVTITAGVGTAVDPTPVDPTPTPTPTPTTLAGTPAAATPAAKAAQPGTDDTSVFEPTSPGAPQRSTTASPSLVATPDRSRSVASATPVATPSGGVATAVPVPAAEGSPAVPSARAAGSDLWSGFATGDQRGASLVDTGTTPASDGSMGTGLAVLAVGLVALLAGVGVAVRRRPVKVTTTD